MRKHMQRQQTQQLWIQSRQPPTNPLDNRTEQYLSGPFPMSIGKTSFMPSTATSRSHAALFFEIAKLTALTAEATTMMTTTTTMMMMRWRIEEA